MTASDPVTDFFHHRRPGQGRARLLVRRGLEAAATPSRLYATGKQRLSGLPSSECS